MLDHHTSTLQLLFYANTSSPCAALNARRLRFPGTPNLNMCISCQPALLLSRALDACDQSLTCPMIERPCTFFIITQKTALLSWTLNLVREQLQLAAAATASPFVVSSAVHVWLIQADPVKCRVFRFPLLIPCASSMRSQAHGGMNSIALARGI